MANIKEASLIRQLVLTDLEKEAVLACLIGDGSLMTSGKHYRLRFAHTIRHADYVSWKYQLVKRLCINGPAYVPSNNSLRVGTVGHSEISKVRKHWYCDGIKRIPSNLSLTPLMLAIWFMDDGTKHGRSVDFSVHCFSNESIEILRRELTKLSIETTVNFDGKGHRIYVRRKSHLIFEELVKPYIVKCMLYKLL